MPDAKYIVATTENHEGVSSKIILVSADTGEVTPIDYEPEPDKRWSHELIAVSPDGKSIACSRYKVGAADLAVIPFGGGTAKRLVAVSPSISGLVWTPDGKELIWAEEAVNNPGLRRIAVDAPEGVIPQRQSGVGEDGRHPVFARPGFHSGVRMAYSLRVRDNSEPVARGFVSRWENARRTTPHRHDHSAKFRSPDFSRRHAHCLRLEPLRRLRGLGLGQ